MAGAERVATKSELGTRVIVGLVMAVVAVGALWFGGFALWVLAAALALVSVREWGGLVAADRLRVGVALAIVAAVMVCAAPVYWDTDRSTVALLLITCLLLTMVPQCAALSLGLAYAGTASIALLYLREQPHGFGLALWTLGIVWATDIGAYFAGRAIGGPKLAPTISPNKTWAGLIGGMVSAVVAGGVIAYLAQLPATALFLAAPLAVVAQGGDLLESWMKRRAGVKDSGRLLPGHGGVLDRLDGALPVLIIVAALIVNGNF
jgi:phosphatidate cytidylyltransferase